MLEGLSHITFAVSDLERSLQFYVEALGFRLLAKWDRGAYLSAGDLWFCLNLEGAEKGYASEGSSHVAFSVSQENFDVICKRVIDSKAILWKVNESEGDSLYFLDPDGHKLEIHVVNAKSRMARMRNENWEGMEFFCEDETSDAQ